jgi:menaquinone-specific isochorismate synthase
VDDVVTSTPALRPGLAAVGVRATLDCDDLYALPARLGACAPFLPQIAWSDSSAGGERWLALGEIDSISAPAGAGFAAAYEVVARTRERLKVLASLAPDPAAVRYLGGVAFDPRHGANPAWPGGEAARFVLPRVFLRQAQGRTEVTVLGTPEPEARRILARLREAAREPAAPAMRIRVRETVPAQSRSRWTHAVQEVLRAIDAGAVRKVVLARDILLDAERPIDCWDLHRLVHECDPHGLRFCLRFDGDSAFMGASPERLVAQNGTAIACDCLAGTVARGADAQAQARNAAALLASEKDGREHRIVLEEILAAIAPHVRAVESLAAPRILTLAEVMHLWSPIRAQLRPGVGLSELIGGLHPTPAVGGSPRLRAMDLIHELEGRSRGWYAGLVGWIGHDAADFAVAIRSGIVRGARMTAFGGAGIVRGSDPHAEWDETGRKAASFIQLFSERA